MKKHIENKKKKQTWKQRKPAFITSTTACASITPRQNTVQEGVC